MKKSVTVAVMLGLLCQLGFSQTSSYGLKSSDITKVELNGDGWLIGKGPDDSGGDLVTKIVYPIRITGFRPNARPIAGPMKVWKIGDTAFVLMPDHDGFINANFVTLVAIPVSVPSVSAEWTQDDVAEAEHKGNLLKQFVDRVGPGHYGELAYKAFTAKDGLLTRIQENAKDVNDYSESTAKDLEDKFQKAEVEFFNRSLSTINESLYDSLGYSQIRLPAHLARLARRYRGKVGVPDGPERTDLMLLNRCLIDKVGEGSNLVGPFQGQTKDLTAKYDDPAGISVTSCPVFPLKAVVSLYRCSTSGGSDPTQEFNVRLLTSNELSILKGFDPNELNGHSVSFPKDASADDLEPYAVLEGAGHQWVISKRGYWIHADIPKSSLSSQSNFMNDWKQGAKLAFKEYRKLTSDGQQAWVRDLDITSCDVRILSGVTRNGGYGSMSDVEVDLKGSVATSDATRISFVNSIDSKISGAGTVLKRDYSPKASINIRPETGEAKFELPLWEDRNYNAGGSTISEARSSIWNQNGVQMAPLLLRGTPSGDTFVLGVYEQDRNREKNPVKVGELVLEWQKA
jgi:hypothetical protein